jgi:Phage Mu protein F like protein.
VDAQAEKYADRLLSSRAEAIARTETIAASNEGQRELWLQAVDQGLLTGTEQREWIASPKSCEACEEMDGETVGLTEEFQLPDGDSVIGPPAHPNCTCAVGLSDKR